jgi:hypothetical protein
VTAVSDAWNGQGIEQTVVKIGHRLSYLRTDAEGEQILAVLLLFV